MTFPDKYGKRYNTQNAFYREKFGKKIIKVPLDGGFSCPNIDGTCGTGGCLYCAETPLPFFGKPIREQFEISVKPLDEKWKKEGYDVGYIPYFQTFSGTYAPINVLRSLYREALSIENTVGLCIATRCDCLNEGVVELLKEIAKKVYLCVELGLQTSNDDTAMLINRGHTFNDFVRGYDKLDDVNVCVHIINGLPNETREDMIKTARDVANLHPHSIKIHSLYIEKGTGMERFYRENPFPLLTREEYIEITSGQIRLLPPDVVIERLTGDGIKENVVAPEWTKDKKKVLNGIDNYMREHGLSQGDLYT